MKNFKKNILTSALALSLSFAITACQTTNNHNPNAVAENTTKSDVVYQVALLQSLMQGEYDGFISVKDIKKFGDFGIGTFKDVNGELIALDGKIYQALYDGSVVESVDNETIPFASVKFFEADKISNQEITAANINELKTKLDELIKDQKNQFYFVRIDADFDSVNARSELSQKPPYKPLDVALKTDERRFAYNNISGTLVGVYFPAYMAGLNTPGWHLHFLSADKQKGGHLLDIKNLKGKLFVDISNDFWMHVPNTKSFNDKNLEKNLAKEIQQVESGK